MMCLCACSEKKQFIHYLHLKESQTFNLFVYLFVKFHTSMPHPVRIFLTYRKAVSYDSNENFQPNASMDSIFKLGILQSTLIMELLTCIVL